MVALLTVQGTAADEAALCPRHDTPANRGRLEEAVARAHYAPEDEIRPGSWTDVSANDYLVCTICGEFDEPGAEDPNAGIRPRNLGILPGTLAGERRNDPRYS